MFSEVDPPPLFAFFFPLILTTVYQPLPTVNFLLSTNPYLTATKYSIITTEKS